jgi:hypothetical protein
MAGGRTVACISPILWNNARRTPPSDPLEFHVQPRFCLAVPCHYPESPRISLLLHFILHCLCQLFKLLWRISKSGNFSPACLVVIGRFYTSLHADSLSQTNERLSTRVSWFHADNSCSCTVFARLPIWTGWPSRSKLSISQSTNWM